MSGYGDEACPVREAEPLSVLPGVLEAARPVLDENPESMQRVERVLELAEGFESAYGLELLASVHWVMTENPAAVDDADLAVQAIQGWTQRKGQLFTDDHIRTAWRAFARPRLGSRAGRRLLSARRLVT